MDDPIPNSWWYNYEDEVYIKVREVVTSNHFIGPYVSVEVYDKDGGLKPASGIGKSRWEQMQKTGDLALVSIPPWNTLEEAEELVLEPEPEKPEEAKCSKCKSLEFTFYRGPNTLEHRWACNHCWATYDYLEYEIIGGDPNLDL